MNNTDPTGKALNDYFQNPDERLVIRVSSPDFEDDVIPVYHFFREYEEMPELEQIAIQQCRGNVLDVGAGAGCHSLILQEKGLAVTALEKSPGAAELLKKRGIRNVCHMDVFQYKEDTHDTVLLLMNGIGIAGTPSGATTLLNHLKTLLNPGGQIILDSSDLIYLFDEPPNNREADDHYYGVVEFQMHYDDIHGDSFNWLYLDENTLIQLAADIGLHAEILTRDSHFAYLARLLVKQ